MNPLISIVVPVYQVEKFIKNSMISICNQSFKNFEVILVNDGTKDNSIEIAEEVLRLEDINYMVINQNNKGVSSARNLGMKNSNGDWVVCVDPDDILYKDFLKILFDSCIANGTSVALGGYQIVSELDLFKKPNKLHSSIILNQKDILYRFLVRDIKIISPAILVRKELIMNNDLWYNEDIKFSEDQHFIWRLLLSTNKVSYNETSIYNYYIRENSTMTSSNTNKILTGYNGFVELSNNHSLEKHIDVKRHILNRWVFGALRASTRMMEFKDFKDLAVKMHYRKHLKALLTFPDYKVKLLSIIALLNLRGFYLLGKKL